VDGGESTNNSKTMLKYKLKATIGLANYSNLQPEIELEGENLEDLHNKAMGHISSIWSKYGETSLKKKEGNFEKIITFTGETIFYDDENHIYKDESGNLLESASTYKKKFEKPFDLLMLSNKIAMKYGVDVELVKQMWETNGKISRTFGDAVHLVMEQFWRHREHGCEEKNYHLPKHPVLLNVVESFPEKEMKVLPEVFVSSVKDGLVGKTDGIDIIDNEKKECNLIDYKTDAELDKPKLRLHFIQLSVYSHILSQFGWTVNKIKVYNYVDGKWVIFEAVPKTLVALEEEIAKKK